MASISHDRKNNRWRIQFISPDGSRRSVSTPASQKVKDKGRGKAETFKGRIEELLSAKLTGTAISRALSLWVVDLPDETHDKLSNAGLIEPRLSAKLGPFLASWFEERKNQKHSTLTVWGHARRNLLDFFGADKDLRSITEEDAERFERWLKEHENLQETTIRKRCGFSKQMLTSAVKARLLDKNPLQALKVAAVGNKKRQYFVTEAESQKVLEACPDAEWRAMFALARYGALRCPSEVQALKWDDIDWANERFHVHASKTEHHSDEGDRVVPLFPEVRKALDDLWEQIPEKTEYVIHRNHKLSNVNPQLGRIIKRAGLKVWPKRWQNLRATRATELERVFPSHVVTGWCGHTERIAEQHYWMTTEGDFTKAAADSVGAYLVQQGLAEGRLGQKPQPAAQTKSPEKPGLAKYGVTMRATLVEDNGLEQEATSAGKTLETLNPAEGSGAYMVHSAESGARWRQIRALIAECPDLPAESRQSLIAQGDAEAMDDI